MPLTDTQLGYLIIGVGIVFVLGLVFAISSRQPGPGERPRPPRGVHLPNPSILPLVFSVAAALLGAGLVFHPEGQIANWFVFVPGLIVLVYAAVGWIRAAGREWHETEQSGSHDDASGH
jgi:hypothetical protein